VITQGDAAVLVPSGCGRARAARVVWESPHTQSLAELRRRYRDDCWVRGWLQFGRAPRISDGAISDLRYGSSPVGNFTTMILKTPSDAARCPANLTAWRPPRADLLEDDSGIDRPAGE
jgi:inner membrane protein